MIREKKDSPPSPRLRWTGPPSRSVAKALERRRPKATADPPKAGKPKDLAIITIIGKDRTGVVAHVSQALYEENVNIEDISQTVMEGNFVMVILVDLENAEKDISGLRKKLEKVGEKIGQQIQIQNEKIFESMHRV